ncbi:zinc finger protein CONSTANS-LIKE 6 [Cryptomeria japonica]|uniref:zinc finger protein CONSTANS-LIKE 6 n=1 Tax=Cryptomeria japonica TaxID=3369 RepID=UPI0025AD994E|nr:zinc finger protein CONSTANS-LIKE 6 [Cryptomeria japonica]
MAMRLEDEEGTKMAMAIGGREIRPCDACGTKRARWFCGADGAYLCHACDTSVHSANSVACRHERVRLTHNGILSSGLMADGQSSWPRKRIRSKRRQKIGTGLLCLNAKQGLKKSTSQNHGEFGPDTDLNVELFLDTESEIFSFHVDELAAPESHGEENCLDSLYKNDGIGFKDCQDSSPVDSEEQTFSWAVFDRVKVEESDYEDNKVEVSEELFDLNIDLSDFAVNTEDDVVKVNDCNFNGEEKRLCLMLNYEDVLSAWSDRGSPWAYHNTLQEETASEGTTGTIYVVVPDLNIGNEGQVDHAEGVPVINCYYNEEKKYGCREGREARVIRYREKRRNRLFSKRIRYQVRKLNAEKRPRMKGRFVKSTSDVLLD